MEDDLWGEKTELPNLRLPNLAWVKVLQLSDKNVSCFEGCRCRFEEKKLQDSIYRGEVEQVFACGWNMEYFPT